MYRYIQKKMTTTSTLYSLDLSSFNIYVHSNYSKNIKRSKQTIEYKIAQVMILETDSVTIPELNYPCEILMKAQSFAEMCKELKGFGETLTISVENESISFEVSDEVNGAKICFSNIVLNCL
eukprot:TRINITY_DN915_c0_g1_i2.p1 TRINITY_DN915_c0_g1~~TRINITY_DN915_c0_g1_i2.p1  ORF type:complete len:122 (+),score=4.99 TRINITY_DN915_c0_g1_i2:268-633(+)